tara:strand:+ start:3192 stop:3716 length:525 start_codon:yes stop_codon:yes gene_type:complete
MDSISNFAESLILNEVSQVKTGAALPPSASSAKGLAPAGKDISHTQVPDSFMKEILGESFHSQETPAAEEMPQLVWEDPGEQKEATPVSLTEETAQQLIPLLEEVKGLLKEMSMAATTSGQIGTNLAGPQDDESFDKVEKSYGYKKSTRSKMSGDSTKKAVLKSSIANKLKRKY